MAKTAVITGASSGIGKALAEKLAKAEYKVILAARSRDKLSVIEKKINSKGGSCLSVPTDVSILKDIQNLSKKASKFGSVSILVNNAGIGYFGPVEKLTYNDWNQQFDVNLRSSFLLSQAFIPDMKKKHRGAIIFINSIAGLKPFSQGAGYVASKYGLRGFASSLREELREFNIKIISVYPGAVDTPFWDKIDSDFQRDTMLNVNSLADSILHTINAPGNLTIEEMVIRRVAGDF